MPDLAADSKHAEVHIVVSDKILVRIINVNPANRILVLPCSSHSEIQGLVE